MDYYTVHRPEKIGHRYFGMYQWLTTKITILPP